MKSAMSVPQSKIGNRKRSLSEKWAAPFSVMVTSETFDFQNHRSCVFRPVCYSEKNAELERLNKLFVGRKFRIKELRDRVKELVLKIEN